LPFVNLIRFVMFFDAVDNVAWGTTISQAQAGCPTYHWGTLSSVTLHPWASESLWEISQGLQLLSTARPGLNRPPFVGLLDIPLAFLCCVQPVYLGRWAQLTFYLHVH
jgi:hypothetical protein